jgi:hypothetical protein
MSSIIKTRKIEIDNINHSVVGNEKTTPKIMAKIPNITSILKFGSLRMVSLIPLIA